MSQIQSMRYKLKKFWPLRSMIATRYFSSEHGKHSGPKGESGLPPWIKVPEPYENPDLLKDIPSNAAAFWAEYKPDVLMDHFERRVKPFLVPRCLFVDRPISDPEVLKLHMMNKHFLGHYPLYTTAITLMERMALLNTDHQNHLLEMLASERVLVFNEWKLRLAPIECLFLDHGTQLAPQSSSTDLCTYKMESDASYHAKSKTATLGGVIWKLGILIDIQVNWGLPCRSCGEAECLGVYSVLIRGRGDLKDGDGTNLLIKKTEAVTDRKYNVEVLSGLKDLDPEYPGLCMAVLQIAKQYDACIFRWAKRETMPLVDDLTRLKYSQWVDVEEVVERHSSKLWGCPIFRIRAEDNKNKTKDAFARWATKEIEFPKRAYIKAEGYKEKLDALVGLLSVLEAPFAIVLVESRETAAKIVAALDKYNCHVLDSECKFDQMSSAYDWCSKQVKALVLVNESNIPPFAAQKALLLVFDKPSNPITYSQSQDSPGVLMITFGAPGPEDTSQDKEVDPTLYGFFRTYELDKKPQETFKIMTYNLCGKEDGSLKERFFALEDIVKEHGPDFICFQGITTKLHTQLQKHEWWKEYFCSIHLPNVGVASNYLMQMSKLPAKFLSIPCSTMREFSTAAVTVKDGGNLERKLLLATCNLEGKNSATKTREAEELFAKLAKDKKLMKHQDVVVCGGMCWNDRIEGKFPLVEGWTDAWEETRKDEEGFTCQLSGNPARADRVVCKVPGYNVEKIDLVGNETGISDHLGLVVRISLKHK